MSSAPPRKRVRRELDLKQKVDMIKDARVKPKPTQKFLSDKYGVGTSTVSDILKKADTYIEQYENNASGNKKRFDNVCKFDKVNTLIWEWFQKAREQNYPLSGPIVQAKATEFAQTLGVVDFKASNGWMTSFKSRHSIKGYAICGEKADVDTNIVDDFITRAPTLSNARYITSLTWRRSLPLFTGGFPELSLMITCAGSMYYVRWFIGDFTLTPQYFHRVCQ